MGGPAPTMPTRRPGLPPLPLYKRVVYILDKRLAAREVGCRRSWNLPSVRQPNREGSQRMVHRVVQHGATRHHTCTENKQFDSCACVNPGASALHNSIQRADIIFLLQRLLSAVTETKSMTKIHYHNVKHPVLYTVRYIL